MTNQSALDRSQRPPIAGAAILALGVSVLVALVMALAGLGTRWGWWHFRTGLSVLEWTAYAAIAAVFIAFVAAVIARPGGPRRGFAFALAALVIAAVLAIVPWRWRATARAAPPIHDITTDLENPPRFEAILPLRATATNEAEYGGPEIAAQQREAYPDIEPLQFEAAPRATFERAVDVVRDLGWEIIVSDPSAGRIEATDRTFWFGFDDDVVIRITPAGGGSRVDIRSVSRVGRGDTGTNARRIREFLDRMREAGE
ncbi:MAG: DUF1499 domain-containing protein [Gemmatimonadaceae bacterium]